MRGQRPWRTLRGWRGARHGWVQLRCLFTLGSPHPCEAVRKGDDDGGRSQVEGGKPMVDLVRRLLSRHAPPPLCEAAAGI